MQMLRNVAVAVFMVWLMIDGVVVFRRKSGAAENRDRFSQWAVVMGNIFGWTLGIWLAYKQIGAIVPAIPAQVVGLVILGVGIAIRSLAMAQLGRFHTPNVAVLADHEVMDQGLYRYIRHPSYLGALIAFLGFSLALGNWLSLLVIMLLSIAAYLFRIHEEEAALGAALGERYASYCRHTKRLIPGIY
jgi:protein-S-isoprenylcysteine O-methyltransferase